MAATNTQTEKQVSLKLLVNKETNKVLFAEAGKDFVDVLFSFLTLPLGTIARLVEKKSDMGPVTVGCLNNLYQSVRDLDKECLQTDTTKEMLLHPNNSSGKYCSTLKLNIDDTKLTGFFLCTNFYGCTSSPYLNISSNMKCECASGYYSRSVSLKHFCNGFVKGGASFIITDNLVVIPNSMQFTSLALLQNLEINGASSVKEITVTITKEKVLDLLKYSLASKSSLSDLFLEKRPPLGRSSRIIFNCDVENKSDIHIEVKLVLRKSDGKVLYAQGEKDFADLLLSYLTFPLGGVVRRLGGSCSLGSIDALHKSISDLDENKYLISKDVKNKLVNPRLAPQFNFRNQILPFEYPHDEYYCFYQGQNYQDSVKNNQFFITDEFRDDWGKYVELGADFPSGCSQGYAIGPRTYFTTDDLHLAPWSPISALNLINQMETPLDDLKEKVITIGIKECLGILKASLTSTSALTNGLAHLLTEVKEETV